ncbi:predicted protein [Micromonas commoda]|jgi:hypothetical protein|uniref:Uncharacterized protein n=1 Tax=Micromonas commoda (strain RCC299 / NOUM17 / CCMP2709) TaxID=296587 RepID=C1EFC4_MICCC|nr:predicted protein [Micromonas commoda]ACO67064.1 predicted protein [Micromonas commoda]|eukprot:XP_002505806.1 predicted protein [Micromonas commoda]
MGDHDVTLAECVGLLSSESRERKFMGMVLVTKLVHGLDPESLRAVSEAEGFGRFLTSMLRATAVVNTAKEGEDDGLDDGLMMAMGDEERETKAEQVTASHALALAVCAALTRSPDVAADPSFQERIPIFAAAMRRANRYADLPVTAVGDACEACAAVIAAGGEEAEAVAGSLGLVAAAAAAVVAAVKDAADGSGDDDDDDDRPSSDSSSLGPNDAVLRSIQLLGQLLESHAASEPLHVRDSSGHSSKDPRTVKSRPGARVAIAKPRHKPKHNPRARAVADAMPSLTWTLASRAGRPEQIESLRCLVLAMSFAPARRPEGDWPTELARIARSARSGMTMGAAGGGWLDDLRGGLSAVMRSKATREMRHAALDLCSAAADLAGPRWLCGDDLGALNRQAPANRAKAAKTTGVPFFRLALELTRVECAVLLHDVSRDDVELRRRARSSLPVPLVLFERLVAALAADAQAADDEVEAAAAGGGGGGGGGNGGLLSAETAQSAVRSLCDVAGLLLEYLENAAEATKTGAVEELSGGDWPGPDPETTLAATRALGAFLAELPDPHAPRVDALLPALLAPPGAGGFKKNKGGVADPGTEPGTSLSVDAAAAALTTRFLLPYLLQSTEDPHGLEAFERARGPAALASLVDRVTDDEGGVDVEEACGVVTAVCAVLRNAMEGTDRGHAEETLASDACVAFADCAGAMSEWAERVLDRDRSTAWRGGGQVEDGVFLRGLAGLRRDGIEGARGPGAWRGVLDFLRALVPADADRVLSRGYSAGGGAGYLSGEDGEEDGEYGDDDDDETPAFDEDPELNAEVRAKFEAMRKGTD